MAVTDVTFETLSAEEAALANAPVRVSLFFDEPLAGGPAYDVAVGSVSSVSLVPTMDFLGVIALLEDVPNSGDAVKFGLMGGELEDTGFTYDPAIV